MLHLQKQDQCKAHKTMQMMQPTRDDTNLQNTQTVSVTSTLTVTPTNSSLIPTATPTNSSTQPPTQTVTPTVTATPAILDASDESKNYRTPTPTHRIKDGLESAMPWYLKNIKNYSQAH